VVIRKANELSVFSFSVSPCLYGKFSFSASCLSLFLILLFTSTVAAQAGGHTLFGDIKVNENQARSSKPLSFQVSLYSESGNVLLRQTVPSNGRYRFLSLRDGRYDVVVELENVEIARVRVSVNSPFKTDFRQDIEFQWRESSPVLKAGFISAADNYSHTFANAKLFSTAGDAREKRRYDLAVSLLRQIVENDPADFPAWEELGTVYFIQRNFEEAEKAYVQALKKHPDYALVLISLGRLRIARKNFSGAIEALTQAVKIQPTATQANYFLGEAYLQVKLGSRAVPYLNEAIRLDPIGMADVHLRLAALYNAKELKDKAAAEYSEFLKKRPDYPDKKKLKEYIAANKKL
jgi:tetratricopeptide (TPR) repeat protein